MANTFNWEGDTWGMESNGMCSLAWHEKVFSFIAQPQCVSVTWILGRGRQNASNPRLTLIHFSDYIYCFYKVMYRRLILSTSLLPAMRYKELHGLAQGCGNSSANALELPQPFARPSIFPEIITVPSVLCFLFLPCCCLCLLSCESSWLGLPQITPCKRCHWNPTQYFHMHNFPHLSLTLTPGYVDLDEQCLNFLYLISSSQLSA